MIQALSIGFRPKCHLEYVHDVPACLPLRCCSKLSMPTASRALTNYVIKGLTFRSADVYNNIDTNGAATSRRSQGGGPACCGCSPPPSAERGRPSLRRRARLLRSSRPRAGQVRNGAPPPRRGASGQPGGRRHSASADKHSMSPIRLCRSRASPDCCRVGTARSAITSAPRKFWTSSSVGTPDRMSAGARPWRRQSDAALELWFIPALWTELWPGAKKNSRPPAHRTDLGSRRWALPVRAVRGTAARSHAAGLEGARSRNGAVCDTWHDSLGCGCRSTGTGGPRTAAL